MPDTVPRRDLSAGAWWPEVSGISSVRAGRSMVETMRIADGGNA
jgi:hypothetical protein